MRFGNLKVLSDEEVDRIIDTAFDVLEKTGCRFDSGWSKKQLKEAGCRLDDVKSTIRVPRQLMEKFLDKIPRLDEGKSFPVLYLPGAARTRILDLDSGRPRPAVAEDVRRIVHVFNCMESLNVASAGVIPSDVPPQCSDAVNTSILLQYSVKPFAQQPYSRDSARVMLSMIQAAFGGLEDVSGRGETGYLLATTGPLRYRRTSLELARMYAAAGLPVVIGSRGRMGREAPATVAGALTLLVAEFMAGVAFIMASDAIAPVAMMDGMAGAHPDGSVCWSGPEQWVRMLGARQVADRLAFPISPFPADTDFQGLDFMTGAEKASCAVLGLIGSGKTFAGAGNLPDVFSLRQLVLDNELTAMASVVCGGLESDDVDSARGLIEKVGPGGSYFGEEHTRKHLQEKLNRARVKDALYKQGAEAGAELSEEWAGERLADILGKEPVSVLEKERAAEIRRLAEAYVEKIKRRGQKQQC